MLAARDIESGKTRGSTARQSMSTGRTGAMVVMLAGALLAGSSWSIAADKPQPANPGSGMLGKDAAPRGQGTGGMMDGGSSGMGGMMGGGSSGMGGMMGGSGDARGMSGMGGMMGMMNMMDMCHRMHGGMAVSMMPQLPPGNEKLQMQMHAEMMQKMGETLAKYAAQLKDDPR